METNILAERRLRVLNFDEMCEYTGYKPLYARKLILDGVIPYSNPTGKKLWFDREKLDAFLLSNGMPGKEKREVTAANYISTNR